MSVVIVREVEQGDIIELGAEGTDREYWDLPRGVAKLRV